MAPLSPARSSRNQWKKIVSTAAVLVICLIGLAPVEANAATIDAITNVVINPENPDDPVWVSTRVQIRADWAAPADSKSGDTFELGFPAEITGVADSFEMKDSGGNNVGSCSIEPTRMICTLSDYVESHVDVRGSLYFSPRVSATTVEEDLTWTLNGDHTYLTHVEGGIGTSTITAPSESTKSSWQSDDGNITWSMQILGSDLVTEGGNDVTMVDTYDSSLNLEPGFIIQSGTKEDVENSTWSTMSEGTAAGEYTLIPDANSFTLIIHQADKTKYYQIQYTAIVPDGTPDGTEFTNTVTAEGKDFLTNTYRAQSASGSGEGDEKNGAVTWSKTDATTGDALTGSEWTLTPKDGTPFQVVDNGAKDEDPTDGAMKVSGLTWGDYTLTETKAPQGHIKTDEEKPVTIGAATLTVGIGEITNAPMRVIPPATTTPPVVTTPPSAATPPTTTTPPTESPAPSISTGGVTPTGLGGAAVPIALVLLAAGSLALGIKHEMH